MRTRDDITKKEKDLSVSDADIPEIVASDHRPHTEAVEI